MRWFVCTLVSLAACSSASSGSTTGDVGSCSVGLEWGVGQSSGFKWLRDGDTAPMTDANGSCFIDSTLRLEGTTAADVVAQMTVTVDGYEPVYGPPAQLQLALGPDGAGYATGLRMSMDMASPSNLAGRTVLVVVHATADGCASWTASKVVVAP